MNEAVLCPFCGYEAAELAGHEREYVVLLGQWASRGAGCGRNPEHSTAQGPDAAQADTHPLQHMEERHAEGQSPFVVVGNADMPHASRALSSRGTGSGHDRLHATPGPAVGLRNEAEAEAGPLYAECPIDGCRELVAAVEMDYHLELHVEEAAGKESDTATAAATASAETTNANSLTVQLQRKPVGRHSRASSREEGAELDGLEPVHVQARERPDRDSGALQEGPADCPRLSKRQRAILESRNIFKMLFTPSSSSVSSRRQPLGPGTGSSSGTHSPLGTPSKRLGVSLYSHDFPPSGGILYVVGTHCSTPRHLLRNDGT